MKARDLKLKIDKMDLNKHEKYMRRCLELAAEAKAHGKTPVGSVIVKEENILAEGLEGDQKLPGLLAHAEVAAITEAVARTGNTDLSECILYTTVEPCFMCSYLIRQTRIREVVFGIKTPGTGGSSSNYPFLTASNISQLSTAPSVTEGVLQKECESLFKE